MSVVINISASNNSYQNLNMNSFFFNLCRYANKTSIIMKIASKDYIEILFTSSNSPIFSPIENLFGYVKGKIKDLEF